MSDVVRVCLVLGLAWFWTLWPSTPSSSSSNISSGRMSTLVSLDEQTATPQDELAWFDPDACAELHNRLVALACEADPSLQPLVRRNAFSLTVDDVLDDSNPRQRMSLAQVHERLGGALVRFLEAIDVFDEPETPLTPHALNPQVPLLWDFSRECGRLPALENTVLLYRDAWSSNAGGVLFDPYTQKARWFHMPFAAKDQDDWLPLDAILRRWVNLWEAGRFTAGSGAGLRAALDEREWVDADVTRAVVAWERLLGVIEQRAGVGGGGVVEEEGEEAVTAAAAAAAGDNKLMVDDAVVAQYAHVPGFARAFFARARRPRHGIRFIAPGITVFDNGRFAAVQQAALSPDRQAAVQRFAAADAEMALLLFPADELEPRLGRPQRYHEQLAKSYVQDQLAGLYVSYGDQATLLDGHGTTDAFQHATRCPWLRGGRLTNVAEMLSAFAHMVEQGHWAVGRQGVTGGLAWFPGDSVLAPHRDRIQLRLFWEPDVPY